jgi:hypothetical protein
MSPTQRSLAYLREQGMTCEVVERWNAFARIRQDLFGIIDIVALDEQQTLGVQTTSWTNVSARVKKIAESPHLPALLRAGWVLEVHGWKKGLSTPKIVRL